MTREDLIENATPGLCDFFTEDQIKLFKILILSMPDDIYEQFIKECIDSLDGTETYASFLKEREKLMKKYNVNPAKNARGSLPVELMTDERTNCLMGSISASHPSDYIDLDGESDSAIRELVWNDWNDNGRTKFIPSDIFFADTISLNDCLISVDEHDIDPENGRICNFRVVVFENYKERIAMSEEQEGPVAVGAVLTDIDGGDGIKLVETINVCKGVDSIMMAESGLLNASKAQKETFMAKHSINGMAGFGFETLSTWYAIQIALLHPTVKTIFQHPQTERIYNPSHDKKKDKRVTCYVKKHVIKSGDVESAMRGGDRTFTRKTMVWYVIGHWRNYSDGRKVFVHPYWKGPLRELKQNTDEGRERKIAIGGDAV